ncbi:hypothetical protein JW930_05805 [Candidatus Woesearchaeota archaeon]|nr:hypothetical protein [Candidatus Woesearchaeota archaeon]
MYLYSNIIGTFVFNEHFKLREKILFSKEESLRHLKLIEEGKILDSERRFLKKFKNIENLRETKDNKKILRADKELRYYKDKFYEKNIYITKHQIKASIQDDVLIIQAVSAYDELTKIINILVKRIREWYCYYLPEISESIEDNETFIRVILGKSKNELVKESKISFSMGADLKDKDKEALFTLVKEINSLIIIRNTHEKYIEEIMQRACPNMTAITGALIAGKLISIAGSLRNLVMFPASTIQLLGAEKALFRHMRNKRSLPPKYGVLSQHPLIQKAKKKHHGKIARLLADKISIAVKIDYFKGKYRGDELNKEIQGKINELK